MQGKLAEVTVGLVARRRIRICAEGSSFKDPDRGSSAYLAICSIAVRTTAKTERPSQLYEDTISSGYGHFASLRIRVTCSYSRH